MIVVYKAEIPRREVESGTELARQWRDANLIRAVRERCVGTSTDYNGFDFESASRALD
jgi:hypothetical protein